jgi:hypothetical protein
MARDPLPRFAVCLGAAMVLIAATWARDAHAQAAAPAVDPPRWYQEDLTPAGRLATLKKEAGAALQEAKAECQRAATQRAECLRQARAAYARDMAFATQQANMARR